MDPDDYTTYDCYLELRTARTASAAWKAKATQMRYRWLQEQGRGDSFRKMFTEQRQRAEAAEKRVAELEGAAVPVLEELIRISEGCFDTERYHERINAIAKLRRAIFDK